MTGTARSPAATVQLRVVATAGHVDHGKSSLIVAPDRHRPRPLGRGEAPRPHDRSGLRVVRRSRAVARSGSSTCRATNGSSANMLAGVGPVPTRRCSWSPPTKAGSRSPRSTCEILDVLGVGAGVVALTKRDLVDDAAAIAPAAKRSVNGSPAPRWRTPRSSPSRRRPATGVDELRAALDACSPRCRHPTRLGPGCSSTGSSRSRARGRS